MGIVNTQVNTMVPPPVWQTNYGDVNMQEQGVLNSEGVYGGGKMKMVGLTGSGSSDSGDAPSYGFTPWMASSGQPLFEGKGGLMQCGVSGATGEYMKDASGQNRCWYVPVSAASNFVGTGGPGGAGAFIGGDHDIAHYAYNPGAFLQGIATQSASGATKGGVQLLIGITLVPLLITAAFFAYRVYTTRRVNKGDEPGVLAKILNWDTWKLWGNKYRTHSHKVI